MSTEEQEAKTDATPQKKKIYPEERHGTSEDVKNQPRGLETSTLASADTKGAAGVAEAFAKDIPLTAEEISEWLAQRTGGSNRKYEVRLMSAAPAKDKGKTGPTSTAPSASEAREKLKPHGERVPSYMQLVLSVQEESDMPSAEQEEKDPTSEERLQKMRQAMSTLEESIQAMRSSASQRSSRIHDRLQSIERRVEANETAVDVMKQTLDRLSKRLEAEKKS